MKSFSRETPSFATFSAISAALHQKVVTKGSAIVAGDMILSRHKAGFSTGIFSVFCEKRDIFDVHRRCAAMRLATKRVKRTRAFEPRKSAAPLLVQSADRQ